MLGITKESRTEKAKRTTQDVVSYLREIVRDERLRADVRAALDHGADASKRVKKAIESEGMTTRIAADRKLRKDLQAMIDDLDGAGDRLRRKKTHRVRNALVIFAGGVAALVAFPKIRPWLTDQKSDLLGKGKADPEPMTEVAVV
jgi:signal transduction protein with GAF and PtsI domain